MDKLISLLSLLLPRLAAVAHLERPLIGQCLKDMAPPPRLTLLLLQPRRKLQLLLLRPHICSFGFLYLVLFWRCFVLLSMPRREDGRLHFMNS